MAVSPSFFEDSEFQDRLTKLLIYDIIALKACALLLDGEDFKPMKGMLNGRPRWIIADRALGHYQKHHEPIGNLIRSDMLEFGKRTGLSERQVQECEDYLKFLKKIPAGASDPIVNKVVRYKQERKQAEAIDELITLQGSGLLTEAKWHEVSKQVVSQQNGFHSSDFFATLENRTERRSRPVSRSRVPLFLIDPLDSLIRGIGPGELGLLIAPTGRGKSMGLLNFALAFALQRLNVLYFTLEDPLKEVEDRLDAAITRLPVGRLGEVPRLLQNRFSRFRRLIHTRLRIIDGTETGLTVPQIEQIILREKDAGFAPHAIIVDYDEEITPVTKNKERRFDFADIYQSMRRVASLQNLIWWTAAQTQRGTESMKILSGDRIAEDISKIRKVSLAIGLGKGDWGPDSIFLWVAKHKFDTDKVGCHIVSDKERMILFDPEKTRAAYAQYAAEESEDDDLVAE